MDVSLLLEYGWVLLILIALEGILAADNALVLAIMVKHLPEEKRKESTILRISGGIRFPIWIVIYDFVLSRCMASASNRCHLPYVYRW